VILAHTSQNLLDKNREKKIEHQLIIAGDVLQANEALLGVAAFLSSQRLMSAGADPVFSVTCSRSDDFFVIDGSDLGVCVVVDY